MMTARFLGAFAALVLAGTFSGCLGPHEAMRGKVVMKIDATRAHVCLGPDEVKLDDPVRLYWRNCQYRGKRYQCENITVADGRVTGILNDHYSEVTFPPGTRMEEGYIVEKVPPRTR
jgi:hypothetical protein